MLAGIVLGFLSGFVLYMTAAMLFADIGSRQGPSGALLLAFFVGWAVSSYLLVNGARSVSKVFTRGSLLGAAEWLVVGAAGLVFSGRAATHAAGPGASGAETAGAAIGGGIVAAITGGMALVMAVVCLIIFTIAYFAGREMKDTTAIPTRKCPECAEMVQAEARRCRHCGAVLATDAAGPV